MPPRTAGPVSSHRSQHVGQVGRDALPDSWWIRISRL
jgi:hypothetical protein